MASITENSTYESEIYLLQTSDPVEGGVTGISNTQPEQLANRTRFLADLLELHGMTVDGTHAYVGQNIFIADTFHGSVSNGDIVFRNTSLNQYEQAISDGSSSSYVVGIADVTRDVVISAGLIELSGTGGTPNDILYLSDSTDGAITTTETSTPIGIYLFDDIILLSISGIGSGNGDGDTEADMYQDLLQGSYYKNITYDAFKTNTASNALVASDNMEYDAVDSLYDFTVGEIITSTDLFDSNSGLSVVTEAMVYVDYTDSGSPTIEATADGGSNWESVTNGEIHEFTNTGDDLRLRFTAGGTGEIKSWAIIYNKDISGFAITNSGNKMVNFYYEGTAQDEDDIINIYFSNNVGISAISINARTAPTGSNLIIDILKDGTEQTELSTLTTTNEYEKTTFTSPIQINSSVRFGLRIKQIGSTIPGSGLNITVYYYDK